MKRSKLDRRLRTVSRIALYLSLILALGTGAILLYLAKDPLNPWIEVTWLDTDYTSLEEVQLLQEYVRIDTSSATGDVFKGAAFLAGLLEAEDIPVHVERVGDEDVNLWAVLEGEDPGAIVLHSHIDVNDILEPERWKYPPFEAHIHLPWIWGRGTYDMKSIAIAQFLAIRDLVRSGARLRKSVVFLATSSEERGSELGTQWILRQHPELVDRFEVVLTEGGVVEARRLENLKYWGTEFLQRRYWTLVACDDSLERLQQLQNDLFAYGRKIDPELRLPDEVRKFLETYAPSRGSRRLRETLSDPERLLRDRALFETLPGFIKAMFRNELYPLRIRQVEGGGWELPVNVHLLPGVDFDEVRDEILPEWLFFGVDTVFQPEPSADHGSPIDHPVMQTIADVIRERYPDVPVGPMVLPWTATDSRFFRARGIPSYGFSPFPIILTDVVRVNGPNERLTLPVYVDGVEIYERLLRRLAT